MENKTIVNSIMESVKKYDAEVDARIEGIKTYFKAEEKRLNNVIDSLKNQLKEKYSNEEFTLVEEEKMQDIFSEIDDLISSASNLEDDIAQIQYSELEYVIGNLEDASYSAGNLRDELKSLFDKVEDTAVVPDEEESKEHEAIREKAEAEEVVKEIFKEDGNLDDIFKVDNK